MVLLMEKSPYLSIKVRNGSSFKYEKVEDCILQGLYEMTPVNGNNLTLESNDKQNK